MKNKRKFTKLFFLSFFFQLIFHTLLFSQASDKSQTASIVQQHGKNQNQNQKIIELKVEKIPRIEKLESKNIVFQQYCQEVENSYKELAKNKIPLQNFYAYKASEKDNLLSLSARCSLPYETIATINSISDQNESLEGKTILLPVVPGLFITTSPVIPYEILLFNKKSTHVLEEQNSLCYNHKGRIFYFFARERFSSTERAFFLDSSMRIPVDHSVVSSEFGKRISPISGRWHFHKGIDLAAKEGEPVYACRGATVLQCTKNDSTYGNFIILNHGGGITSVYAHLSNIIVKEGQTVFKGQQIGNVGQTGLATGPHLHFEILQNNVPSNPKEVLTK